MQPSLKIHTATLHLQSSSRSNSFPSGCPINNLSDKRATMTICALAGLKLQSIILRCLPLLVAVTALLFTESVRAQITFDGVQSTLASGFSIPQGVAVDQNGNVYFGDTGHNEVKEILAVNGLIPANPTINILGSGFSGPKGVAVDVSGNVYVADFYNNAVKEILAVDGVIPANNPTINTLGTGFSHPSSVAVDGYGDVFVADSNHNQIKEIMAIFGSIPTINPTINTLGSGFSNPTGVAVDGYGNVYVADEGNNLVKQMVAEDGSIPASHPIINVIGSGFRAPSSVAVDRNGNVFVADSNNHAVKEMLSVDGSISVVNPVTNSLGSGFSDPNGVAVDTHGNVFVADAGSTDAFQVSVLGVNFGSQAIGSSSAAQTLNFSIAAGTTVGSIGVFTSGNADLDFANVAGSTCTPKAYSAATNCQVNVTFSPLAPGNRQGAVVFFSGANSVGTVLGTASIYGNGIGPQIAFAPAEQVLLSQAANFGGLSFPEGIAVDGRGDLFVVDEGNNRVVEAPAGGGATTSIDPTVDGVGLNLPDGIAIDGAGDLFIADKGNSRVVEVPVGGGNAIAIIPTVNGVQLANAYGVAADGKGDLFIADTSNNRIVEVPAGNGVPTAISPMVNGSGLSSPGGVAVDGLGDLFIADTDNNRVVEVPAGGGAAIAIAPTVNSEAVGTSYGIAVDGLGDLFIADINNNRIVEVPASGQSPTAINLMMIGINPASPFSVAVDGSGNVFGVISGPSAANGVIEVLRSKPRSLVYSTATEVGATDLTDGTQTVVIQNIGNETLDLSAITYPEDFPLGAGGGAPSACQVGYVLLGGQECDLLIQFKPKNGGALSENVTLTDNSLNLTIANQLIPVRGTAIGVALSATSLSFGNENVGVASGSQSVTMTNLSGVALSISSISVTGADASSFVFANTCGTTLAVNASCTIHGHFAPMTSGALTAAITINDSGPGSPQSITLTGNGVAAPAVKLSATSLSFGSVNVGASSGSEVVTLTNAGDLALSITSITLSGAHASSFVFANSCGASLAAGANCTIHGHFAPTTGGPLTAVITITDNAGGSPQSITVSGTGVGPAASLSATSLAYGTVKVGTASGSQTVTLTNNGSATLTITSIALTGADAGSFVFANSCGTSLAAGANCTIHGHFAPTATGALTAAITITDNAGGSPQSIALSGTGQ